MPNYRESNISGTKWTRAFAGSFSNPYQGMPTIRFEEEAVVSLADGTVIKQNIPPTNNDPLHTDMSNGAKEFPLLNPVTGETIGLAKYQDVFVILHSLYTAISLERDQVVADRLAAQAAAAQAAIEAAATVEAAAATEPPPTEPTP